ncbi:cyanoexosortase B system-associated protein [Pleurocapsales cyanobacterium LEGE 06147]|nr:cyanoexosortase B system-associated protein [Pleurocapsales cyanobacterium LEGE 06147]
MNLSRFQQRWSLVHIALILGLIILILVETIPGYWQEGKRSWLDVPQVSNINQIRSLRQSGLELPDWQTLQQQEVRIGGRQWSVQVMQKPQQKPVMLLLRPQNYYLDKPEVDWMDINGLERWKTDSYRKLHFTVQQDGQSLGVTARFFRAWNRQQTFAVVQWYAFPHGGHYSPAQWFWQDRLAQLHRRRVAWVAVCLKIPIEPLGKLSAAESVAESLAITVQAHLQASTFSNIS